ncbi:MAG TPA: hypothetical protein DEQ02_02690 [Ruminococcaceae bacterium]|nr:hypothetical protein [Oscillospiraceae bacterium]
MFIIRIWRFIIGYVRFKCTGGFGERFLNLCAHSHIQVWEAKRGGDGITGYVAVKNYRKLVKFRKKAGVRLKIEQKYGLPFILRRYRLRFGLLLGIILFFGILNVLSLSIWSIEVVGNERAESENILAVLEKYGLKQGVRSETVDAEALRLQLLLDVPELSWAAINIEGCFATVEVTETLEVPDSAETDVPGNLKAASDGRIIKMEVLEGEPQVKVGEAVLKGDLLISGTVEHQNEITVLKRASGSVIAETVSERRVEIPLEQLEMRRTGKVTKKRVASVFGFHIPLYLGSTKGLYEKETEYWDFTIEGVTLPLRVTTGVFYEQEEYRYRLSTAQAVQRARNELQKIEHEEFVKKIIQKREETIEKKGDVVIITIKYLCEEEIAVQENILINDSE